MKKKIIIITIISIILTFIIYFYTKNDEINLVSLGDSVSLGMTPYNIEGLSYNDYLKEYLKNSHKLKNYIHEFSENNITIKELIYEIKENKSIIIKNKKIEIQRAISEADILTIAIGMDEISKNKITTKIRNEFYDDLNELLSIIKVLNDNKVIVLSHYKTNYQDDLSLSKINAIIRDITITNNFIYIDINKILQNEKYYFDKNKYYINYLGNKRIYEEIKKNIL